MNYVPLSVAIADGVPYNKITSKKIGNGYYIFRFKEYASIYLDSSHSSVMNVLITIVISIKVITVG